MSRPAPIEAELRRGEAATWGPRPDVGPARPKTRLLEWRAVRRNTLRGFAVVELPSGLVIRDISVHEKAGKSWAALPSRPVLDTQGRHISNHAGHKQYAALLGWRDRDLADQFSVAVVELIQRVHPDALGGKGVVS